MVRLVLDVALLLIASELVVTSGATVYDMTPRMPLASFCTSTPWIALPASWACAVA
jgi:hypothetical protein